MRRKSIVAGLLISLLLLSGGSQIQADSALPGVSADILEAKEATAKIGSQLAAIASGTASSAVPSITNGAAALLPPGSDSIIIDAVAAGDADTLVDALEALGAKHIATFGTTVSVEVPIDAISSLRDLESLRSVRPFAAITHGGLTTSQGDLAMRSDIARTSFGVDGSGILVGTLSDSFDCLGGAAGDVGAGDLPAGIAVLADEFGCGSGIDEGRAMMQLIADVAPGAAQSFHSAFNGMADFALGIEELAGCPPGSASGCVSAATPANVVVDDVIYFAEAMFQDDIVAQAVDVVEAAGVSYFSSAGNQGRDAYSAPFTDSGVSGFTGKLHDFGAGDTCQSITLPTGLSFFSFQYNQPFASISGAPGATTDLDIGLFLDTNCAIFSGLGGLSYNRLAEYGSGDAVEVFGVFNAGAPATFGLAISSWAGVAGFGPYPSEMRYVVFSPGNGFVAAEHATDSGTVYGHSNAAGAETVGAARYDLTPEFGVASPIVESYSSAGPTPIYFNTHGIPIGGPGGVVRPKPEIVAPDGTNTTFFGFDFEPDGFPNFFGTSAAAPHAAAVAALMLEFDSTLDPSDVYSHLEMTAIDMDAPSTGGFDVGFDFETGYGLIQADAAIPSCHRLLATHVGTMGSDWNLSGGVGDDVIVGLGGDDTINGGGGADTICGGPGKDNIRGGLGNDLIFGDAGADKIEGNDGDDTIFGGEGSDWIRGYNGNDWVDGGPGVDIIQGNDGEDELYGGEGNDRIAGGRHADLIGGDAGDDYLYGNDGNDSISGDADADTIYGGSGDDSIRGMEGDDFVDGETGNDSINGGEGDDRLVGNRGNDVIFGGIGADRVKGSQGDDRISGGANDDVLDGGDGNDEIYGGYGNDVIGGYGGNDRLFGNHGDDKITGSGGDDLLDGGAGIDSLDGGWQAVKDTCLNGEALAHCEVS